MTVIVCAQGNKLRDVPDRVRVVVADAAVARALRDAGMEVVLTGDATPERLVPVAIQEDADAAGTPEVERLTELLGEAGAADVVVFATGADAPADPAAWVQERVNPVSAPDPGAGGIASVGKLDPG